MFPGALFAVAIHINADLMHRRAVAAVEQGHLPSLPFHVSGIRGVQIDQVVLNPWANCPESLLFLIIFPVAECVVKVQGVNVELISGKDPVGGNLSSRIFRMVRILTAG